MKQTYIVADNAFTVSAPDDLTVWEAVKPRFSPFAARTTENLVLAVSIKSGQLPESNGEKIYEPAHGGIGFITGCVSRMPDGGFIMEFRHIDEHQPRLLMKMTPDLTDAEIVITPHDDAGDAYFLAHALMIAFVVATSRTGTLMIHASAVVFDGKAYLFQGRSGTGKSTHAALWMRNIAGTEQLNDDNPLIRFAADGTAMAYGSPWSGKTPCYRNVSAPLGAMVRIVRADVNELRRLVPLKAYASLTASVSFVPFLDDELREMRHRTIERLVETVPCCEMYCRPDADAALTCMSGLTRMQ